MLSHGSPYKRLFFRTITHYDCNINKQLEVRRWGHGELLYQGVGGKTDESHLNEEFVLIKSKMQQITAGCVLISSVSKSLLLMWIFQGMINILYQRDMIYFAVITFFGCPDVTRVSFIRSSEAFLLTTIPSGCQNEWPPVPAVPSLFNNSQIHRPIATRQQINRLFVLQKP